MAYREPPRSERTNQARPKWATIAFYVGLLLLVAWLKFSTVDGGPQHRFPPDAPAAATDRQLPAQEHDATRDDGSPQSRVMRNAPAEEAYDRSTPTVPSQTTQQSANAGEQKSERDDALVIRNVRVLDEDRRVVYRGDVDLGPTLKRIESGKRLRFSHDGIVFENRERRLPAKPSGYYREYVQPTPGDNGPGAQRVVLGAGGEVYYTSDHYRSFRRVR